MNKNNWTKHDLMQMVGVYYSPDITAIFSVNITSMTAAFLYIAERGVNRGLISCTPTSTSTFISK